MRPDPNASRTTPMRERCETLDTVEIVRRRLANGRAIADADVHRLVAEIDRLRKTLEVLGHVGA